MFPSSQNEPFFREAILFTGGAENAAELIRWIRQGDGNAQWIRPSVQIEELIGLRTPHGVVHVIPGDWIVLGIRGDFYPIKPKIFSEFFAEKHITQGDSVANLQA